MKEVLNKTIEVLRARVNSNLERIRTNESMVKRMIEDNVSGEYNRDIQGIRDVNKKLLEENNEAIKIQMGLVSLIAKYRKVWDADESVSELIYSEVSEDEIFEQTVNGELKFNKFHPKFSNDDFIQKLIEYYSSREDYEMCSYITKIKR